MRHWTFKISEAKQGCQLSLSVGQGPVQSQLFLSLVVLHVDGINLDSSFSLPGEFDSSNERFKVLIEGE